MRENLRRFADAVDAAYEAGVAAPIQNTWFTLVNGEVCACGMGAAYIAANGTPGDTNYHGQAIRGWVRKTFNISPPGCCGLTDGFDSLGRDVPEDVVLGQGAEYAEAFVVGRDLAAHWKPLNRRPASPGAKA